MNKGLPQEVWSLRDPSYSREKKEGKKKFNFLAPVLPVHERKSEAQTAYPSHLACQCLKIRSFCPHNSERITYILWLSVDRFARSYGQVELTKEICNGKGIHFPCKYYFKGSQGQIRPLVFKEKLPTEINEGLCFQINCMLLSLASGHGIKSDEPTKQHWAAPVNSHHQ